MDRRAFVLLGAAAGLTACAPPPPVSTTGDSPIRAYRIRAGDTNKIQLRMLESVNALRQARGVQPLQLNAELTAAAATHSRDMSVQNRPWHFGSDGSSPLQRVQRVGYAGRLAGEVISETYENETQTLAAWMDMRETAQVLLDPAAADMGFSWFQEENGKIWWTLVTGYPGARLADVGAAPAR